MAHPNTVHSIQVNDTQFFIFLQVQFKFVFLTFYSLLLIQIFQFLIIITSFLDWVAKEGLYLHCFKNPRVDIALYILHICFLFLITNPSLLDHTPPLTGGQNIPLHLLPRPRQSSGGSSEAPLQPDNHISPQHWGLAANIKQLGISFHYESVIRPEYIALLDSFYSCFQEEEQI